MWAAEEGKSDTLKILIDRGAKGDLRDKVSGNFQVKLGKQFVRTKVFIGVQRDDSDLISPHLQSLFT